MKVNVSGITVNADGDHGIHIHQVSKGKVMTCSGETSALPTLPELELTGILLAFLMDAQALVQADTMEIRYVAVRHC